LKLKALMLMMKRKKRGHSYIRGNSNWLAEFKTFTSLSRGRINISSHFEKPKLILVAHIQL